MTEILAGAKAASIAKDALWDPLMKVISSSNDMKKIHEALNKCMETVRARWGDHEETLQKHKATKKPSKTYSNWSRRVRCIEDQMEDLNSKYETKRTKSKFFGFYPRSKFTKKMRDMGMKVNELRESGTQLGDILVEKEPDCVVKMIAPDIRDFPTLQNPLEQLLDLLTKRNIRCVSVHGMMGIGKTSIMQNLNNHGRVVDMFEIVIWVKISTEENNKNLCEEEIQQSIVRRLNLDVKSTDQADDVAQRIRKELSGKKYLLLLDDIKENLKFDQIGIDTNSENGSKIVFTTRLSHVCRSIVNRAVKVRKLSQKEAWIMFQNVLGHSKYQKNPNIERLMHQVVQYCDGLPFVIKLVAGAFKMRDTHELWSDGFNNLRKWPEKGDNMMKEMYKLLNFCCDSLEGVQKVCFYYSAIYPEDSDIHIDCLLDCWAAEGLYGSDDDALQQRVNGRTVLEYLKMASLFEEGICNEHVRMHKLIRQSVLYTLSADDQHKCLVKTGESLQEAPGVEDWKHKKWISLVSSKLPSLPERPDCSTVSTLFLQENPCLKRLPSLFFKHMENLRVLNLCCTAIASLPSSLSKLIRLKVLYLNRCTDLMGLPMELEKLELLQVIDMRGSGVLRIPSSIEKLNNLRRLLVSFANFGNENDTEIVSHNCDVISKISALEELIIEVKSAKRNCNKMLNVVTNKIGTLTKLTTLQFCFEDAIEDVIKLVSETPAFSVPTANSFTSFVPRVQKLGSKSFEVFIGCSISSHPQIPKFYLYKKYLRYCNGEGCDPTISTVLAKADAFELVNHKDLERMSQFSISSMDALEGFYIEGCSKIRAIADGTCKMEGPMLPNLLCLYMKKLPELETIWKGSLQLGSLSSLTTLRIEECSTIEELFSELGSTKLCRDFLPKLEKLALVNMPKLRRICAYELLDWISLWKLKIHACPNLTELPFNKESATRLKLIETEQKWWDALTDSEVKQQLQHSGALEGMTQPSALALNAVVEEGIEPFEDDGDDAMMHRKYRVTFSFVIYVTGKNNAKRTLFSYRVFYVIPMENLNK